MAEELTVSARYKWVRGYADSIWWDLKLAAEAGIELAKAHPGLQPKVLQFDSEEYTGGDHYAPFVILVTVDDLTEDEQKALFQKDFANDYNFDD